MAKNIVQRVLSGIGAAVAAAGINYATPNFAYAQSSNCVDDARKNYQEYFDASESKREALKQYGELVGRLEKKSKDPKENCLGEHQRYLVELSEERQNPQSGIRGATDSMKEYVPNETLRQEIIAETEKREAEKNAWSGRIMYNLGNQSFQLDLMRKVNGNYALGGFVSVPDRFADNSVKTVDRTQEIFSEYAGGGVTVNTQADSERVRETNLGNFALGIKGEAYFAGSEPMSFIGASLGLREEELIGHDYSRAVSTATRNGQQIGNQIITEQTVQIPEQKKLVPDLGFYFGSVLTESHGGNLRAEIGIKIPLGGVNNREVETNFSLGIQF